jgi:omega-amidase
MDELKIVLIQSALVWEDAEKNLASFSRIIAEEVRFPVDVIFLPEMFNTGFSINPERCAEEMDGRSIGFLIETAKKRSCTLMTTLLVRDGENSYNRQVTAFPDGTLHYSDKRHLFRLSDEYRLFTQGKERVVENVNGWNILPLICFDLRFPVWSRNTYKAGNYDYDLLVYLSNWPASRSDVWKSLLVARAIENLSYVIGVNRIGPDGFGTDHTGESMIVDPRGRILFSAEPGKPVVYHATLSMNALRKNREDFPFGPDWDHFSVHP